jgi:hypothetical protein
VFGGWRESFDFGRCRAVLGLVAERDSRFTLRLRRPCDTTLASSLLLLLHFSTHKEPLRIWFKQVIRYAEDVCNIDIESHRSGSVCLQEI